MDNTKTKREYLDNPRLHLRKLYEFKLRVKDRILGEIDPEWRGVLEYILEKTDEKIDEVKTKLEAKEMNLV